MSAVSRGPLYPKQLPQLHRWPPPPAAARLVRWFWIAQWQLEPGIAARQPLIGYPAMNLVVETDVVGLAGPATRASFRDLSGSGWAVGALLWPAATPALTPEPSQLRDRYVALAEPVLQHRVSAAMALPDVGQQVAVAQFSEWLVERVGQLPADALMANRLIEVVEDPEVVLVGDLASRLGVSPRTVQRLSRAYVGLPPTALIRRRRIQQAAERLRDGPDADLAAVAADLGYADQAHLTHDFVAVLGLTPGGYRRSLADPDETEPLDGA